MSKQENKLRVYEYAKSLNMSSKEIITILKRVNAPVNNHMSVMEPEMIAQVEQFFRDVKANAEAKRAGKDAPSASPGTAQAGQTSSSARSEKPAASGRGEQRKSGQRSGSSPSDRRSEGQRQGRSSDQQSGSTGQGQASARPNSGDREPRARQGDRSRGASAQSAGRTDRRERPGQGDQGQARQGKTERASGQPSRTGSGDRSQQDRQRSNRDKEQGRVASTASNADRGQAGDARKGDRNRPGQGRPAERTEVAYDQGASKGKTTKKTKSNQRRFDDNKVSTIKSGPAKKSQGRQGQRGRQSSQPKAEKIDNTPKKIIVRGNMTVGDLAKLLHKDASEVIKKLLFLGVMATINQELDIDAIQLLAAEYNVEVEIKLPVEEDPFEIEEAPSDEADLVERPPVVTIMGHVDHGKTTLLDAIRHTRVSEGEAGGITQHIGAYQTEVNGRKITFLDTPGHEAFTTMRARGATVTDITILVVAADDGVMPQTVEAISHAKAAKVPIIVAVNKVDKPTANPERIKQELTEYELVPEEWGGDTIFVNVSAKQRTNLEELLEMVLLVSEVAELRANPNKAARGTVVEAELDKGRGPVARVLVQDGTLRIGDPFVAGVCFGRVRAMVNDKGRRIKEAGPSTPVEITGLTEVPQAGDRFIVFEDERKAREIADKRATKLRQTELGPNSKVTLDDLYQHIKQGEIKELNVIIKGDVQGTVEALRGSLEKIDIEGVKVRIIHTGAGAITESDIILASASNAIIIGFNVRPEPAAKTTAEHEKVDIRLHSIIYKVIEEIEAAMKGMLDPEYKESVVGQAEVREIFKISRIGTIAGCMVISGKVTRNSKVRLIRDGIVVHEGEMQALKRFKDDVREVAQGYECGISLHNYNDIKEGDVIEAFEMVAIER